MNREYYKHTEYTRYVDLKKLAFIVSFLSMTQNSLKGLDVGCGEGNVTIPLASLGYNMIGFDMSAENIEKANRKKGSKDNPMFFVGDAENLGITEKENFDFVICSEVLEHLRNPEKVLNSINKILKINALLILTVPNGYGLYSLLYDHFRNKIVHPILPRIGKSGHIQSFTLYKVKKLVADAGFDLIDVKHSDIISFLPILVRSNTFCYYDCKLADRVPPSLVSGYYLGIRLRKTQ